MPYSTSRLRTILNVAPRIRFSTPTVSARFLVDVALKPRSPFAGPMAHVAKAQVVGRKTVWLAPPTSNVTKAMYSYPPPSPASDREGPRNPVVNQLAPSMTNTSQVDVFSDQDEDRFPLFWKYAVPEALSATLEPGDVLFFPPGWWHAMRSEELSFSVSMWF